MRDAANPAPRARCRTATRIGPETASAAASVVALLAFAAPARAQSFTLVVPPPDIGISFVFGLSADGRSAAGYRADRGFLWTADGGRNDFGLTLTTRMSRGFGISGDGLTVVGGGDSASSSAAFRWSQAGGYQNLGTLPGYVVSDAKDANHDGSIIVGTVSTPSGVSTQAFRWTQSGGMQGLGAGTRANAISGDGNQIIGELGTAPAAFTWTQAGGMQFLPALTGTGGSYAQATNFDGSIIVGQSGPSFRPTMWVNGTPSEILPGSSNVYLNPQAVSDSGAVVAGQGQLGPLLFASVWTAATGTIRLSDYLTANGVTIPDGITLTTCTSVSADGKTFAGYTDFGPAGISGYVATIATPCPADLDNDGSLSNGGTRDHAVTIDDLLYFLAAFESGNLSADLDNGSGTGTHDGAVTIDDLLFFLAHFEAGC